MFDPKKFEAEAPLRAQTAAEWFVHKEDRNRCFSPSQVSEWNKKQDEIENRYYDLTGYSNPVEHDRY